ncbi:MAG: pilus assembly protein [Acidobacteria bacterium]|nr:pilus assembly protein [Acidobacteriota bacterium]MCA1642659.1 pilus assembly protein [Acidobacteriota bacterium]
MKKHTIKLRAVGFLRGERGTQLVELALVLPIMLMLLASIAEFGNFFYTYSTLSKATRGGARYLTSRPFTANEQLKAASLAVYGDANAGCMGEPVLKGLTCGNIKVKGVDGSLGYPNVVNVRVDSFVYQPLFDLGKLTNQTITLKVPVAPSTTMKYLLF